MPIKSIAYAAIILLAGCAGQPERATFADIQAKNAGLIQTIPDRIRIDIEADCADGYCTLPENNLQILADLLTRLQDDIETRISISNNIAGALNHCEYASYHQQQAIAALEQANSRQQVTSSIRELALGGICGVLLLGK